MDHGDRPGVTDEHESGPWEVDLQQTSNECDGTNTVTIIANVKAPPPRAGPGYEYIPGVGYYKLHTQLATWEDARKTCMQEGAHLLVIDTDEEATSLKKIFSKHTSPMLHIGASDKNIEGVFTTVLGQPLRIIKKVKWFPDEPNDAFGGEDCVNINTAKMLYNDIECDAQFGYVCEQEL